MASLRSIRGRIKAVRNMQKITKALKLVSAAKLRRAQDAVVRTRPYAQLLDELLGSLARARAEAAIAPHPLMEVREPRRIEVVLLTSDRGLCGGFNAMMIREASHFVNSQTAGVGLITVGKKGRDYFRARGLEVEQHFSQPSRDVRLEELGAISKQIIGDYSSGKYGQVFLGYSKFVSVLRSTPVVVQLLPLETPPQAEKTLRTAYQFEPEAEALLNTLLPQYVEVVIYRALVESIASEQAARMIAMKGATDSASEMIDNLTREYNRVRQGSITTQILEVVSGAEALEHSH
jgi:F-type H+-transporting ATPase subunit gamma